MQAATASRCGLLAVLLTPAVGADMIEMVDYTLLSRGMTEAEVLYRVGPFDHESVETDYHHNVIRKTWYYIPAKESSDAWITEIQFDQSGVVQSLDRYRARK